MRDDRLTLADNDLGTDLLLTRVVTPEGVLLEFRSAGIGSRALAKMLDIIFVGIGLMIGSIVLIGVAGAGAEVVALILSIIMGFLALFVYPLTEAWFDGATLGKRIVKLKVVTVDGGPVRLRHAAIRAMIGVADFWIPPGGIVALASALFSRRSQRLGDFAAGTLVVRSRPADAAPLAFPVPAAPIALHFGQTLDVRRLDPRWYGLLRDYWQRWNHLDADVRQRQAQALAGDVCRHLRVVPPPGLAAPDLLGAVLWAAQREDHRRLGAAAPTPPPPSPSSPVSPAPSSPSAPAATREQLLAAPPPVRSR